MEDLRTDSLGMGRNEARLVTGLNQVMASAFVDNLSIWKETGNSFNLSKTSQNDDKMSIGCEYSEGVARPKASGSTSTCREALAKDDKNHDDNLDDRENE